MDSPVIGRSLTFLVFTVKMIEDVNATDDFRPQQQVMIYECGELASS